MEISKKFGRQKKKKKKKHGCRWHCPPLYLSRILVPLCRVSILFVVHAAVTYFPATSIDISAIIVER
jgi:hypothetical protein